MTTPIPAVPARGVDWYDYGVALKPAIEERVFGGTEVNAGDHNLPVDGVADVGPALRAAIAALPVDGGTVFVPAGNYFINTTVYIPSNTHLRCSLGARFTFSATPAFDAVWADLRTSGAGNVYPAFCNTQGGGITSRHRVSNLHLTGPDAMNNANRIIGLLFSQANEIEIIDCDITKLNVDASLGHCIALADAHRGVIRGGYIAGAAYDGLRIGGPSSFWTIDGVRFGPSGSNCAQVAGYGRDVVFTGCILRADHATDTMGGALLLHNASRVAIIGCQIYANANVFAGMGAIALIEGNSDIFIGAGTHITLVNSANGVRVQKVDGDGGPPPSQRVVISGLKVTGTIDPAIGSGAVLVQGDAQGVLITGNSFFTTGTAKQVVVDRTEGKLSDVRVLENIGAPDAGMATATIGSFNAGSTLPNVPANDGKIHLFLVLEGV